MGLSTLIAYNRETGDVGLYEGAHRLAVVKQLSLVQQDDLLRLLTSIGDGFAQRRVVNVFMPKYKEELDVA